MDVYDHESSNQIQRALNNLFVLFYLQQSAANDNVINDEKLIAPCNVLHLSKDEDKNTFHGETDTETVEQSVDSTQLIKWNICLFGNSRMDKWLTWL